MEEENELTYVHCEEMNEFPLRLLLGNQFAEIAIALGFYF